MIIEFGDWRLVPVDTENWELAHRHVTSRGKNEGAVSWHRLGHYYQQSTFANAIEYAADRELRESDGKMDLGEYVRAYGDTLERFRTSFADSQTPR